MPPLGKAVWLRFVEAASNGRGVALAEGCHLLAPKLAHRQCRRHKIAPYTSKPRWGGNAKRAGEKHWLTMPVGADINPGGKSSEGQELRLVQVVTYLLPAGRATHDNHLDRSAACDSLRRRRLLGTGPLLVMA